MPNGNDTDQQEERVITILDPALQEEIQLTLSKGEAFFIFRHLEANIAPRGADMVEFAYNLLKRFDQVRKDVDNFATQQVEVETTEAVVDTSETRTAPATIKEPAFIGEPPKDIPQSKPVFGGVTASTENLKEE